MAGGFLSSIICLAVDKLRALESPPSSASADPPRANIEQEMTKLKKTMRRIQAKLAISEEHDSSSSEHVKLWLSELKDTAYGAQDVVEEYEYELLRAEAQHEVSHLNTAVVDELASKVKQIIESSEKIAEEWKALKLIKKSGKRKRTPPISNRQTGSLVPESGVLGREEEKKILLDWILSEDDDASTNRVSVIALTGMGGLGKTTVAQLVYNDLRVKSYFDLRGWISVSEHFDVAVLSRKISRSFFKETVDSENVKELQHELKRGLKGKKFLLVLDDVWNEEFKLWNQLKKPLMSAKVGKVVVTTRLDSVARIMQTTHPLILDSLPFDACWSLFKRIAFAGRDLNACQDLVNIGWCIAEKCKGLPLAIKVLGGALRNEEDEERWIDVLESEIWELDKGQAGVLPVLKITYDSMPMELKRCFPYLSLFPKYTVLHRRRIVPLWMSHGLLQPARGKQVEEVGYEHLKELVERSMLNLYVSDSDSDSDDEEDVTDVYDEDFGNTLVEEDASYVMHDLVHDLARYVAQDEYLCVTDAMFDLKKWKNKVRHLTVNLKQSERAIDIRKFQELRLLRTLFIRGESRIQANISGILDDLFRKLKCLRTLDLGYTNITELPESVGSLKLLRSFSIRGTRVKRLPESICNLYNLQTLNLSETYYCEVPRPIGNLVNLRHLFLYSSHVYLPPGIGNLTNLQTLSNFFVSRSGEYCGIGELNGLVQLRGLLSIDCLRYVSKEECLLLEPPLKTKLHLNTLSLSWGSDGLEYHHHVNSDDEDHDSCEDAEEEDYDNSKDAEEDHEQGEEMAEQLLEGLRPHNNLEKLYIDYYHGLRFAGWVGDPSFDKLVQVFLSGCRRCKFLPPLGRLPSLKVVHIEELYSVQHIGREFCASDGNTCCKAFPKLETLSIRAMPNWVKWDGVEVGDFPAIDDFQVRHCPKLTEFPQHLISAVKELHIEDSGGLLTLRDLHSLTHLFSHVRSQNDRKWMFSSYLPALQHLTLESSASSIHLSRKNLPSLKTLEIRYSPKLASIEGLNGLISLNSLVVRECPRLEFKELLPATLEQVKLSESPLFEQGYNKQLKERRAQKTI